MHRRQLGAGLAAGLVLALASLPAARANPAAPAVAPAIAAGGPSTGSQAGDGQARRRHALSLIGEPRMPADFKHFEWVNPKAPKGGAIREWALGTFDTLNRFVIKGTPASGLAMLYDSLMQDSPDESSTAYGLLAEWVSHPDDFSSVTFGLRQGARFNDGEPVKPEDVIWSLETLKQINPSYATYYKHVVKAEKTGEREVTFRFDVPGNRELPYIVGQFAILPKHFWTGKAADGSPRDITKASLDVPLGSGPYRIKEIDAGRSITYERVKDYWAKDLPVQRGQWNFDEMKFVYFRDNTPAHESFKIGQLDFFYETSAKSWATAYDFDAVKRGLVRKETVNLKRPTPMQAFVFNTRRPAFQDWRVRLAFNHVFDFEWANKNIFFDQYLRVSSYFDNQEFKATGLPTGRELEILNEVRGRVPPEVFTREYMNPVNRAPEDFRRNMTEALRLLKEAGWEPKDGVLTHTRTGEQMKPEFLLYSATFDRIVQPYMRNLERLGIRATSRVVDASQYTRRIDTFDFDIVVHSFAQSESPGNEQREYWGSASADREGSRNLIGIKNSAVDKIIEKVIFAQDRAELVAATRALDRVLCWNHYVVPQWHAPYDRIAYWDVFGKPARHPARQLTIYTYRQTWWHDAEAARKLAEARSK